MFNETDLEVLAEFQSDEDVFLDIADEVDARVKVNAMLGRARKITLALGRDEAVAAAQINEAQEWIDRRRKIAGGALEHIKTQVVNWHAALVRENPERKTIDLPNGVLRSQPAKPEWKYPDEEAFVAWASKEAKDLLHEPKPPTPDKTAVKKTLTVVTGPVLYDAASGLVDSSFVVVDDKLVEVKTGEVVEGCTVEGENLIRADGEVSTVWKVAVKGRVLDSEGRVVPGIFVQVPADNERTFTVTPR